VFSDSHSRTIGIAAVGGTCLWCIGDDPVSSAPGVVAAFEPSGTGISFISTRNGSAGSLWSTRLGSSAPARQRSGRFVSADWSKTGKLAVGSGGFIWVAAGAHAALHRLTAGSEPSWSPDGLRVAFDRRGWIWTVAPDHGVPRRVIQGTRPVSSPNGRELAFVGHGGFVYVVGKAGGHPRRVGRTRARSIAWQPVTAASSTTCNMRAGATILATSPESIVWSTSGTDRTYNAAVTTWHACLRALGNSVSLGQATSNFDQILTLGSLHLAGPYVAWYSTADRSPQGGNCNGDLNRIDLRTDQSQLAAYIDCSVPSATSVESVQLNANGFMAWRQTYDDQALIKYYSPGVGSVSCPSISLCVAADGLGNAYWSTDPASGANSWDFADIDMTNQITTLSCPSTQLCVAFDESGFPPQPPNLLTTTDPTGGIGAWTPAPLPARLLPPTKPPSYASVWSLSCPTANFCAALSGNLLSSTDPAGGPSTWSESPLPEDKYGLLGLSCAASTLCVAVDTRGRVLTSTDPTAGANAWTITSVDAAAASSNIGIGSSPEAVSCPTVSLCVAIDGSGRVLTSTDPAARVWQTTTLVSQPSLFTILRGITCSPSGACIVGNANTLYDSADPTGRTGAWTSTAESVNDGTCASATLCMFFADRSQLTSTNAFTGSPGWTLTTSMPYCTTFCVAEQIYSYDSGGTQVVAHVPPGTGDVLTNLSLSSGNVLTWEQGGTPESETLK
jgi:hypothetical protein